MIDSFDASSDPIGPGPEPAAIQEPSRLEWFALYVRSRHERTVERSLLSRGLQAIAPFYKVRRRRADRNVDLEVPIFPSYVFCQFEATKRLPILQTSGVVFIVSRDGQPEPIDSTEVASIQKIAASGRAVQPWDFLQNGQRVRIRAGSLAGAEGILVRIRNRERLVVSVTVLQRSVAVEIDQDMVEPIY